VVARTAFIVDAFGMIVDGRDGEVDDHGSIVAGGASAGSPWPAAVAVAPAIARVPDRIATSCVSVDDGSAAMFGRNDGIVRDADVTASTPTGTVVHRGAMATTVAPADSLRRGIATARRPSDRASTRSVAFGAPSAATGIAVLPIYMP